jgi:hypothetical protein
MQQAEKRLFPMREAYAFAAAHGLEPQSTEIREMEIEWDHAYTTSVRRGRMIVLLEHNKLLPRFFEEMWPQGASVHGESEIRRCKRVYADYETFLASGVAAPDTGESESIQNFEFALEAHLRDFLAKNLERLEPGLQLYEKDSKRGVEFSVDAGRIDILALDRNNHLVVVELKLSRGRNAALGQLLYYMGWVDQNLGNAPCRGIIVANEITEELVTAVSRVPGVALFRYRMSFGVEPVG